MKFILPEPPSANRWWRNFRGRMVLSEAARNYKLLVAHKLRTGIPLTGPIKIEIVWVRKIKSGDLDKRIGILQDALQGVAYINDGQIEEINANRYDKMFILAGGVVVNHGEVYVGIEQINAKGVAINVDNKPGAEHGPKRKTERVGKNGVESNRDKGPIAGTIKVGPRPKGGARRVGPSVCPVGGK